MKSLAPLLLVAVTVAWASPTVSQNRCVDVPRVVQETINEELIDASGPVRVAKAQAVRTTAFRRAHFVSAVIYAPGLEDGEVLTWLVSGPLTEPASWMAADNMTKAFTFVPYAGDTSVGRVINEDGYRPARACAVRATDR